MGITRREVFLVGSVIVFGFAMLYYATEPRRQTKVTLQCGNNLRYISTAMMQYAQDFDDTLPRAWFGKDAGPSDSKSNYKWMDAIYPYIKNTKYFLCPSDRSSKPYKYRSGVNYGSYLYNNAYFATGDKFSPPSGQKLANISDKMTVLVMDGENDFQFAWAKVFNAPIAQNNRLGSITVRHFQQMSRFKAPVTLWVNGLVQGYSLRQVVDEKQVKGQRMYSGFTIESD